MVTQQTHVIIQFLATTSTRSGCGSRFTKCCLHIIATSQARFPKPLFENVQLLCEEQPLMSWISSIATSSRQRDASPERFPQLRPYNSRQSTSFGHLLNSIPTATPGQEHSQSRTQTRPRESSLRPVELGRIRTQRLQHRSTVGSMGRKQSRPFEPTFEIGAGKPLSPPFLDERTTLSNFWVPMTHCTRRIGHP